MLGSSDNAVPPEKAGCGRPASLHSGALNTLDCFHTVALADVWDRFEKDLPWQAGALEEEPLLPIAPSPGSEIHHQQVEKQTPQESAGITVGLKKSAMILLRKTVMAAVELDFENRENFLTKMKTHYFYDAKDTQASDGEALEWAQYLDQRVRKMVDTIGYGMEAVGEKT